MSDRSFNAPHHDALAARVVVIITILVLVAVVALRFLEVPDGVPAWATWLPGLNATLNSAATLVLIMAYLAIRAGHRVIHQRLNLLAFLLSSLFLVSYVAYHAVAPSTTFPADHPVRPFYLLILISHIILAALVLPLVLTTFWLALTNRYQTHRRIARWTLPVWLYVTVTGVVVYWMIRPHYPF